MSLVPLLAAVAGVLGLAVGSFLNVVIHRVPRGESVVSPPSHCPRCDAPIKARHNVPVLGWLALRGRCHGCTLPISARYPVVEAATGTLFVALTLQLGATTALPAFLYLAAIAVTITMIDADLRQAPRAIVAPSYVVASILLVAATVADGDEWRLLPVAVGSATLAAALLATSFAARRRDPDATAVAALLGLYLGYLSWTAILLGALAAALAITCANVTGRRRGAVPEPPAGSRLVLAAPPRTKAPVYALLCLSALVVVVGVAS